jgi:hypothetical protein
LEAVSADGQVGPDAISESGTPLPQLAFYYPGRVWSKGSWVKNLLLFFDGIALMLPTALRDAPFLADPALATGLNECGLLHVLESDSFIDTRACVELAKALQSIDWVAAGELSFQLATQTAFHDLFLEGFSGANIGWNRDFRVAGHIYDLLIERGAVSGPRFFQGGPIAASKFTKVAVFTILAQVLRRRGREVGLDLQPTTDTPAVNTLFRQVYSMGDSFLPHGFPASAAQFATVDAEIVGFNVEAVPLDELLAFRTEHGLSYRRYMHDLRSFVHDLGNVGVEDEAIFAADRREAILDAASDLRKRTPKEWRRYAQFGVGIVGATWRLSQGDGTGAALGMLTAGLSFIGGSGEGASAFSYLFEAKDRFGWLEPKDIIDNMSDLPRSIWRGMLGLPYGSPKDSP